MSKRSELLLLVALLALVAVTRFYRLGAESLWLDEAATYLRAVRSLPDLVSNSIARMHNPTYFLMMHAWITLGDDEVMLRAPSAVFGICVAGAGYALGRVVGGILVGTTTLLLVALAPQQLRYAQEARMYSMYAFATTLALAGLLWLVQHPEQAALWPRPRDERVPGDHAGRAWLAFGTGTLLALYTHNTAVFFVAAAWLGAGVAWAAHSEYRRPLFYRWFIANALVFFGWSLWLPHLLGQTGRIGKQFWATFPPLDTISRDLRDLFLFTSNRTLLLPTGVAIAAVFGLWSLRKRPIPAAVLALAAVAPPLMILAVSLKRPIFLPRIMLWSTVPFFVVVASGICALEHRFLRPLALIALLVLGGRNLQHSYYGTQRKPDWRGALSHVAANVSEDSTVLLIGGREIRLVRYYLRRKSDPIPDFKTRWAEPPRLDKFLAGKRWAWLITAVDSANSKEILSMMKTRGRLVWQRKYGKGLRIVKYRVGAKDAGGA